MLLSFLDGTKDVTVNRTTGVATITMKESKTLTRDAVEAQFKDSQYTLKKFEHLKGPDLKRPAGFAVTVKGPKDGEAELTERLKAIDGVVSVKLDGTVATVTMKPDKTLTKEAVFDALKDSGFSCESVEALKPTKEESEEPDKKPEKED